MSAHLHGVAIAAFYRATGNELSPLFSGGEGGIRTHGRVTPSAIFETVVGYFGKIRQVSFRIVQSTT